MQKFVYEFTEGGKDEKDLLGGKGANLAEMTRLGLPVPPGFTVTTEACRRYLTDGAVPPELRVQVTRALRALEDRIGRQLGDPQDPLLVSVRSGAKFSMPGHDGDRPERRAERRLGPWARRPCRATSASRGTPTAGWSPCSARPCWASRVSCSPRRWTRSSASAG